MSQEQRTETIKIKPSLKDQLENYIRELIPYATLSADDAVEKLAQDFFNHKTPEPPPNKLPPANKPHRVFVDEGIEDNEYMEEIEEHTQMFAAPPKQQSNLNSISLKSH